MICSMNFYGVVFPRELCIGPEGLDAKSIEIAGYILDTLLTCDQIVTRCFLGSNSTN